MSPGPDAPAATGVAVIVCARDAAATLPALLDALPEATAGVDPAPELVVVDAGSVDATRAIAREHGARVALAGRAGAGTARNVGSAATRAGILAFLDADCVPRAGWLAAGLRALEDADLAYGAICPDPLPAAWFDAGNLLARRAAFRPFEDWIAAPAERCLGVSVPPTALGADALFGWRAVRSGARVARAAGAVVDRRPAPRSRRAALAERKRVRHVPRMVREIPELRAARHRRVFHSPTSAAFDLALAGGLAAALARSPLPLLAALPYARRRPDVAADAITFLALVRGSVAARTPVL
jgi:glycosyltransferase involved in cell wall biosynthesis